MIRRPVTAPLRSHEATLQRINVSIANCQRTRAVDLRLLRCIVHSLLSELSQISRAELGICLIAAPEMTRLNETFLRHAGSTDVITFDYSSPDARSTVPDSYLHGEIFICVDEAVIQARRFRTSWQSELVRYLLHAILHLLGFDDGPAAARRAMKQEENLLLRSLAKRFHFSALARHRASARVNRKS
jgi:rRNA maturation RNase YbeY